jgi:hypothetical protein
MLLGASLLTLRACGNVESLMGHPKQAKELEFQEG